MEALSDLPKVSHLVMVVCSEHLVYLGGYFFPQYNMLPDSKRTMIRSKKIFFYKTTTYTQSQSLRNCPTEGHELEEMGRTTQVAKIIYNIIMGI